MLTNINFIQIYILVTFLVFIKYYTKNKTNSYLFFILLLAIINETIDFFQIPKKLNTSIIINTYLVINHILWFLLMKHLTNLNKKINFTIILYVCLGLLNLFFYEGMDVCNVFTFILGSIFYIICFTYYCYEQLKKENLQFFLSNNFIILFSPILFFLGQSLILAYRGFLNEYIVFGDVTIYNLINRFINIIYYMLIILFMYKEHKTKNGI